MRTTFCILCLLAVNAFATEDIFKNEFEQNIAIRVSQSELVDPHLFVNLLGLFCTDVTSDVNDEVQTSLTTDGDNDGFIDSNSLTQFSTDQPAYITSRNLTVDLIDANCADPLFSEACVVNQVVQQDIATDFNVAASCLQAYANTTGSYTPAVNSTLGPCYSTAPINTVVTIAGVDVDFKGYQQASRYPGVLSLDLGLTLGFISEADADTVIFPDDTPVVGGETLSSLLPGGTGNCSSNDDRDFFTDGVTLGWWFYFNTASDLVELN